MDDRELVKKIQTLRSVQPREDWVDLVREDLLGSEQPQFGWFLAHWRPALTGLALGLALMGGLLGLIRLGQVEQPAVVQPQFSRLASLEDPLTDLRGQIVEFKEQLAAPEPDTVRKSRQASEIQQIVLNIRELTEGIEQIDQERVLALLSGDIKEAGEEIKMAFLEAELNDLREQQEQGVLPEDRAQGLAEVEQLYQADDHEGAFWRLMELVN